MTLVLRLPKPFAWGDYQDGGHLIKPLLNLHQTHNQSNYKVVVLLLSSKASSFCFSGSIHDALYADMTRLQVLYHIVAAFVLEVSEED